MTKDEKFRGVVNKRGARLSITFTGAATIALVAAALLCSLGANSVLAAPQTPAPPVKILKYHGTVVSANVASIILRNPNDPRQQMGFSLSPAVHGQMIAVMTAGGFHYGDRVTIYYAYGTNVALKLHGKPSKPKKQQAQAQPSQ